MRSNGAVLPPPLLDHHPCLVEAIKYFTVEQLIAQIAVEALAVSVLPRAAWFDIEGCETRMKPRLFERISGRLHLTPEANVLFQRVAEVHDRLEAIEQLMDDLAAGRYPAPLTY